MELGLLANDGVLTGIVIAAFCVLCALCILYGVLRKFYRTTWLGWQIALIFPCVLVLEAVAPDLAGISGFAVCAGVFFAWAGIVLGGGALFRYAMLRRARPAKLFYRIMNRILGGLTALVNLAVFGAVFGGFALAVIENVLTGISGDFASVFSSGVWEAVGPYAFDLFLVAALTLAVRGGYRVGLGRAVFAILMLVLTLGCVLFGLYLPIGVLFGGKSLAMLMAGTMKKLNPIAAFFIGYGISALIVFVVSFALILLLGWVMNLLVRKCRSTPVLSVVDGAVLSLISYVLAVALWCGLFAVIGLGASDGLAEMIPIEGALEVFETISLFCTGMRDLFLSSPFSALLFTFNPIALA